MAKTTNTLLSIPLIALLGILVTADRPALAGPNDFFGTSVPSGAQAAPGPEANPYADTTMPEGDFTEDEKRMQKRYKAKVKHAKNLIAKGKKMIASGQKKNNKKMLKKGKIFLDIGERELKELAANNPLSNLMSPTQKAELEQKKQQTAQSTDTLTQ